MAKKISVFILVGIIFILLISQPINLTNADLGRHIKNGELVLSNKYQVLSKNLYSYTLPDFPFLNHHWGSGVIFYLIYNLSGFLGVHILYIFLSLATFVIFFHLAYKNSNIYLALIISIILLPLAATREEIRPEVFSYLFIAAVFWLLYNFISGKVKFKYLFFIPVIELFWVNLHIYFPLGIILIGIFIIDQILTYLIKKQLNTAKNIKKLLTIALISSIALIFNPAGLNGILYPAKILESYGYKVFENQNIFFISKFTQFPDTIYFILSLSILSFSYIYPIFLSLKRKKLLLSPALFFTSVLFGFLAFNAIRNIAIFAFFVLVISAVNYTLLFDSLKIKINGFIYISAVFIITATLIVINPKYWEQKVSGLGLIPGNEKSGHFFQQQGIKGPIFNNYDIGGYLIFYLDQKVFVDNRPEAYPEDFFQNTYIPMQEDDKVWRQQLEKYSFNSIFFYRRDLTPWGQKFLITRIQDEDWAPVYVDDFTIIFLRRDEKNSELVKKFELPKEMFEIKK